MKTELLNYALNQIIELKEMETASNICVDFDKINLLLEEWLEKHDGCSKEDVGVFFSNIHEIVKTEIGIRELNSKYKGIWLTK